MWIEEVGEINEQLMLLGTRKTIMYLLKGDRYTLLGGGGQWIVPELERQFREFQIDMDRVQYLVVGHTHYDHCGAVPYLQKRYPHLQVLASQQALNLYSMEKAVRNMRTFSQQVMQELGLPMEFEGISLEFDGVRVARTLREGERLDLGGQLSFRVYETPGHSRCAITLYEPQKKWLFPTDSMALPVDAGNRFASTASESFIVYLDSLKKLAGLEVDLCAWEHFGVMTAGDAKDIVRRVMRFTLEYKRRLAAHVDQTGDIEETARRFAQDWLDITGFEFLPQPVMLHITRGMVQKALEEQVDEAQYL
jgi:glyoxylase-like metal-dependent hydrolase (beta-lactamase superfamily II)